MNIEKELFSLKDKMNKATTEKAVNEAKIEELMDKLKREFGCSSIKAGKKRLQRLEEEIEEEKGCLEEEVKEITKQLSI